MINEVDLPTGWISCLLEDIFEWTSGGTPTSSVNEYYSNGTIPWLNISDLNDGIVSSSAKHITELGLKASSAKMADANSILIAIYGSIGKLGINAIPVSTNQGICFTKNFPLKMNHKFLFYYLLSIRNKLINLGKGGTQQNISQTVLNSVEFKFPALNEQNRIVDKIETLFSEVDAGIANLTLAKCQLEQYRQSLLKHAFEGKLTAKWREEYAEKHGKSLPNADELLEQIQTARLDYYDQQIADWEQAVKAWEAQGKEGSKPRKPSKLEDVIDIDDMENLPTLPDEWRFHRLADIAEVGSGMSVSKNRKVDNPIEVNYLRVANVQRGYLDLAEIKTMTIDKFTFDRYKLLEGDILFNEGGDRDKLGRGWIWKNEVDNCITQNHVFRASTHIKNIAHSEFISHWGNTFGRDYFERTGKQTTNLASINKTVLSSFPAPYPSIEEQSLIVRLLNEKTSEVDNLVTELELQLKKANLLKTSILYKAFQGKLVPQDPNDPPASELLAQIKAEREAKALAEKQAKQDKAASKSKAKTKSAKTAKKSKKDEQITLPL